MKLDEHKLIHAWYKTAYLITINFKVWNIILALVSYLLRIIIRNATERWTFSLIQAQLDNCISTMLYNILTKYSLHHDLIVYSLSSFPSNVSQKIHVVWSYTLLISPAFRSSLYLRPKYSRIHFFRCKPFMIDLCPFCFCNTQPYCFYKLNHMSFSTLLHCISTLPRFPSGKIELRYGTVGEEAHNSIEQICFQIEGMPYIFHFSSKKVWA